MKILYLLLALVTIPIISYSQTELPIKFKANEDADVWIGQAWDYSYKPLKNPLNVVFDGNNLKMFYDSGKVFWETNVLSYERKEKKNNDKLENEAFTLKIEKKSYIQYLIIEKSYSYGSVTTKIKIPYVTDTGETMSYHHYQQF